MEQSPPPRGFWSSSELASHTGYRSRSSNPAARASPRPPVPARLALWALTDLAVLNEMRLLALSVSSPMPAGAALLASTNLIIPNGMRASSSPCP